MEEKYYNQQYFNVFWKPYVDEEGHLTGMENNTILEDLEIEEMKEKMYDFDALFLKNDNAHEEKE